MKIACVAVATLTLVIGTRSTHAQTTTAPIYATSTTSWTGYIPQGGFWYTNVQDLAIGSRNQSVADLQGFLIESGFLELDPVVPRGYFGTLTQEALVRFQLSRGIPVTGRLDADTKTALSALIIERSTPSGSTGGYWYNGVWYVAPYSTSTGSSTGTISNGYWYNGLWYNVPSINSDDGSATNNPAATTSTSSGTSTRRMIGFFSGDPTRDGFNGLTTTTNSGM